MGQRNLHPQYLNYRVLLIEDSRSDAAFIQATLRDDPLGSYFDVTLCPTLGEGLERLKREVFSVVLLDLNLTDSFGFDTFLKVMRSGPPIPIIVLTSVGGEELAIAAVAQGAQDFIFKDRLDPYWVPHAIRHAIGRHELLKRAKAAELREIEAAQKASQAKSDFLASMSHELRNPIAGLLLGADILLKDQENAAGRQRLAQMIKRSAEHLLAVVNDVLDLSKVEAGCLTIEEVAAHLPDIVADVKGSFEKLALDKGLALQVVYAEAVPRNISTDPTRLRQILFNLVGNGIKFTQEGSVTIKIHLDDPQPGGAELVFDIIDTGLGISAEQAEKLFQSYAQADSSIHKKYGGTGLGLMLSRRLAQAMGGSLELERSELGGGSVFRLRLPRKSPFMGSAGEAKAFNAALSQIL